MIPLANTIRHSSSLRGGFRVHFGSASTGSGPLPWHHFARRGPTSGQSMADAADSSSAPRERLVSNAPHTNATIRPRATTHHRHHLPSRPALDARTTAFSRFRGIGLLCKVDWPPELGCNALFPDILRQRFANRHFTRLPVVLHCS